MGVSLAKMGLVDVAHQLVTLTAQSAITVRRVIPMDVSVVSLAIAAVPRRDTRMDQTAWTATPAVRLATLRAV